jgi:hypothetical protein
MFKRSIIVYIEPNISQRAKSEIEDNVEACASTNESTKQYSLDEVLETLDDFGDYEDDLKILRAIKEVAQETKAFIEF